MLHLNEGLKYKVGFESRDLTRERERMPRMKMRVAPDLSGPADEESASLARVGGWEAPGKQSRGTPRQVC